MEDSSSLRFHLADLQLCLETLPIPKTFDENESSVIFFFLFLFFSLDTARYIAVSFFALARKFSLLGMTAKYIASFRTET